MNQADESSDVDQARRFAAGGRKTTWEGEDVTALGRLIRLLIADQFKS